MPGMILFNRRWAISTDDFLWIGLVDTVFYLAWLCWSAVSVYNSYEDDCSCNAPIWCSLLKVFLVGSCCLFSLSTMISVAFVVLSTRGTISQPGARIHVPKIVLVKSVLSVAYVVWAILGSVLLTRYCNCGTYSSLYIVKVIVACLWFVLTVKLLMVWMFYDPRGRQHKTNKLRKTIPNEYLNPPVPFGSSRKWRHRFQAFCFWFTTKSEDRSVAISTVSELLAFISFDVDLVASDLIAGLMLYRRRCLKNYAHEEEKFESTAKMALSDGTPIQRFPTADMPPWMNLKLANHYFTIGMGIFGWPWTLYRNIACGLCQLCKKCIFCFPCKNESQIVEGDNCCGCNFAGLQTISGLEYQDIVHVCFVNRVYQIPFFVTLDHSTSSVIVTSRGSMSCADALTDVSASFEPMDESFCPKDTLCHGGLLTAARRIKAKLEENRILEKAFEGRTHYNLVLTGHSLGAGVATLLTLMYRNTYNVRCFAFAPPPVLNEISLPETYECVFTVVYGNDVVPYLNYWNIRNLVVNVVDLLKECQLPKHKVFMGCPDAVVKVIKNADGVDVESGNKNGNPLPDVHQNNIVKDCDSKETANGSSTLAPEAHTRFYVAGRILNIKHSKKYGYRLRMCDSKEFQPLLCKRKMLAHHLPQYLEVSLKQLGRSEELNSEQLNVEPTSVGPTSVDLESAVPSVAPPVS